MGLLQKGAWVDKWYDTEENQGEFKRHDSQIRHWVTSDGEAGPTGKSGFKAEKGRYHLFVSLACPWAHRTLIFRELKELTHYIDVTIVDSLMQEHGWTLDDPLYGFSYAYELYLKSNPKYEGRVTVPILWDKQSQQIVSNESADIIRMFNSAFNHLTFNEADYYPKALQAKIDEINEKVYHQINNGVYKAGFATTQSAYEYAYYSLFDALEWLESILSKQRYVAGNVITEADWRLFTTLIRFDSVYHGHFKCNKRQISTYPALSGYVRELYQITGVDKTVNMAQIKAHYYASHTMINPTGIIPLGPDIDYTLPHGRG